MEKLGPQSAKIKKAIEHYLDIGIKDKQRIYTLVVEELTVPRPSVRRVARDIRNEYEEKVKILQTENHSSLMKRGSADLIV